MGRMPAWLHEVLPCFPRRWVETYGGLTSSSQSGRGRPCVRSSRSACATGTAASWLHAHASPDRLERISRKRAPPECFCFEKRLFGSWKKENVSVKNDRGARGARRRSISIARNEVQKQAPLYSSSQFRRGFELQPPPLSDTTLAERMPLRIPGTTITHSGP
jgi:hypothetical protein